jgi:methionyl aminopeptidase
MILFYDQGRCKTRAKHLLTLNHLTNVLMASLLQKFVKTPEEIKKIRHAAQLAAQVLTMIEPHVQPGKTTDELNTICHDYIVNTQGAIPAPLNYHGFPKSICTSINHVICHGIPNQKKLKKGDIIGIDISLSKDGYFGDTCKTFTVGACSIKAKRLVNVSRQALYHAISLVKPGVSLRTIGAAIEQFSNQHFCAVVHEYCGHGIGTALHEEGFQVLHYDSPNQEPYQLVPGLTFTIEPMINLGKRHCSTLNDQWTVITKDRSLSSQFEHTLLVTEQGVEVLSKRPEETDLP